MKKQSLLGFLLLLTSTIGMMPNGAFAVEAVDSDGDGVFSGLVDALYILAFQFQGGTPPPPAPYPNCGVDPDAATSLGCDPNGC